MLNLSKDSIKLYGNILLKGGLSEAAPKIAKGALVEFLVSREVDRTTVQDWVLGNKSLWEALGADYQQTLKELTSSIDNIDWLTYDWVVDSIKHDLPAVASLLVGWRKAHNWLIRQIELIKGELGRGQPPSAKADGLSLPRKGRDDTLI